MVERAAIRLQHRNLYSLPLGEFNCLGIASVDVASHAHARVVGQYPFDALSHLFGAICASNLTCVLGVSYPHASSVVDRYPGSAAGGIHQWEKLGKAMGALGINFFPVFWGFSSAMVETVGGLLIVIGFCFRPTTILMTFNFVVATVLIYKTSHQFIEWSRPAEMLILFFSLIFIGAGKYSVDRS